MESPEKQEESVAESQPVKAEAEGPEKPEEAEEPQLTQENEPAVPVEPSAPEVVA